MAFYQCALKTSCSFSGPVSGVYPGNKIVDCFCGPGVAVADCEKTSPGPSGPCQNEILDGLELPRMPSAQAPTVLARLASHYMNSGPGWSTSFLGAELKQFTAAGCSSYLPGFTDASTGD